MKDQILALRKEGKSYREIEKILGCSKGTINYHCSQQGKAQNQRRRQRYCRKWMDELKISKGGKCNRCGFDKHLDALDFHHTEPLTKNRTYNSIAAIIRNCSVEMAKIEIAKCELICANCHRIHHSKQKASRLRLG